MVVFIGGFAGAAGAEIHFSGERKLNNLVSELLEVSSISKSSKPFTFTRSSDGWIFISSSCNGNGTVSLTLDKESRAVIVHYGEGGREAMRYVTKGKHTIQVECNGEIKVKKLVVRAIPEHLRSSISSASGSSRCHLHLY